jgi:hypothetical protein
MRQFARTALALLAVAGILYSGQMFAGDQAVAAPVRVLQAAPEGVSLFENVGYRRGNGRYDCTKIRHYDGSFNLYCRRREVLVKQYLCDKHVSGPNWRMHCRVIWVRPDGWRYGGR